MIHPEDASARHAVMVRPLWLPCLHIPWHIQIIFTATLLKSLLLHYSHHGICFICGMQARCGPESDGSVHPLCVLSQGMMMWPHMTLPAVSGPPTARHALALLWPPRLCPLCLQLCLLKTWQKASFTKICGYEALRGAHYAPQS